MTEEEKYKRFKTWKDDLEERLARFLWENTDDKDVHLPPQPKTFALPNTKIEVQQSESSPNSWRVVVNNVLKFMATGPTAHAAALRFADQYLNLTKEEKPEPRAFSSIGLPAPCVFCGNRVHHRTDCPDAKKDGPILPPSGATC